MSDPALPVPDPAAPVFVDLPARRVGSRPDVLDRLTRPHLRIAPDEALVLGQKPVALAADPHAIDVVDGGWCGARINEDEMLRRVATMTDWEVGPKRPQLLQGLAAGVPVKVDLPGDGHALVVVARPYLAVLQGRWR